VTKATADRRIELVRTIQDLAGKVVYGSLSEIYRTCGTPSCRCHGPGPKHGPHLQIVYKGDNGKTTGCYVPIAAQQQIRDGAAAWQTLQDAVRELGSINRDAIVELARAAKAAAKANRPTTSPDAKRPTRREAGTGA
jgi:hypothetical protein